MTDVSRCVSTSILVDVDALGVNVLVVGVNVVVGCVIAEVCRGGEAEEVFV